MDPYSEIEVTPLYSRDGMKSQGKSVRIADAGAQEGWSEIGVVSPNYLLVHNAKVKGVVNQLAELSPIKDWKERKVFFDGKRFVYAISSDDLTAEVTPGDIIRYGLIAYNSYDGTRSLNVGAYAEHVTCSNGMTSDMYFARFSFRHHQGNIDWDEQTQAAFTAIMPGSAEKLTKFAQILAKLKDRYLTINDLTRLRREYLNDLSTSTWGKVIDRYLLHEAKNAFGLLDACTSIFWQNEKQNVSDFRNNSVVTDALVRFSDRLN